MTNSKTKNLDLPTTPRSSHKASIINFFFLESTLVKLLAFLWIWLPFRFWPLVLDLQPSASSKTLVAAHVRDFHLLLHLDSLRLDSMTSLCDLVWDLACFSPWFNLQDNNDNFSFFYSRGHSFFFKHVEVFCLKQTQNTLASFPPSFTGWDDFISPFFALLPYILNAWLMIS